MEYDIIVQKAAKILAAMKSIDATAQIEASTVKYLEASLTPAAMKSIVEALATKHRAEGSKPCCEGRPHHCI